MLQKTSLIWMDGKLIPWESATVHILSHTIHYGMGAFEGIRCYKGTDGTSAVFRLKEHVDRLFESALIGKALRVQVTATIVTRFRDREQPSIESDVAYLRPVDGRYQLLKASAALWRAVGKPDVPPEVIAPPPGFSAGG